MSDIEAHCLEIERCNQRGGRMLSVVDLLEAETISLELAAYLLAAIRAGASFMVGAMPGGAGKTTIMGALLNFVAPGMELRPADRLRTLRDALKDGTPARCYVCHEIGPGPYYAYLWDEALRVYFELPTRGHQLATNLHADTLPQARSQLCDDNGVPAAAFLRMNLALFLRVEGGWPGRRRIVDVWESDGAHPHVLVYQNGVLEPGSSRLVTESQIASARRRLEPVVASGARTVTEVRAALTRGATD